MKLFSRVFGQLFGRFAHFSLRRKTPKRAQQCAAQELAAEKLPEQCEAFDYTVNDKKCRKRRRKVPEKYPLGEREEEREVKGGSLQDEAEITLSRVHQKREMPSLEKLMEGGSELREAGEKKRKERKRKERKITGPTPLLVEVKPVHTTVRYSSLKPIEGELPKLPSVSGHLALPAAHFKPLPPVTKPPVHPQKPYPALEDVLSLPWSLQVDPPKLLVVPPCPDEVVSYRCSSSQMPPLEVPPSPTSAPDEVVALRRPPSRKPQLFTSFMFDPPPQLMLVDIEDEENEYVEYTGKTFRASDLLKSERPRTPEAEIKPRKMVALLKDSEVQEEVWASKVVEVQGFEKEEGDPSGMEDSKGIQGHSDDASQIDELMMKRFCVASPDGPKNETQYNVNVQTKCKRKVPLVLFT